jgi:hypothetical protein
MVESAHTHLELQAREKIIVTYKHFAVFIELAKLNKNKCSLKFSGDSTILVSSHDFRRQLFNLYTYIIVIEGNLEITVSLNMHV